MWNIINKYTGEVLETGHEAAKDVANQPPSWELAAEQAEADDAKEWRDANEANRIAEGRWEDNGCQPVRDL